MECSYAGLQMQSYSRRCELMGASFESINGNKVKYISFMQKFSLS